MVKRLPASLRARFDAYAEGVNAWLAQIAADPSKRPLEFIVVHPAPWRAVDSAAIGAQLDAVRAALEARGIEPGGPAALRLFS